MMGELPLIEKGTLSQPNWWKAKGGSDFPRDPPSGALSYNDIFQQQAKCLYEPDDKNMKVKLFHTHETSFWLKNHQLYVQRLHLVIRVQVFNFSAPLNIDLQN